MDPMSEYLARAVIEARIASASERRTGRRIEDDRRAGRRQRRRQALASWWRRRAARGFDPGSLALAVVAPDRAPTDTVARLLEDAAHRIADRGTWSECRLLEAMSAVAGPSAPAAAAALVDWEDTETSRLRAFGLVHGHVLNVLGPREHAWLLDLLDGGLERARLVA